MNAALQAEARRALDTVLPQHLRGTYPNMPVRLRSLPARRDVQDRDSETAEVHVVLRGWIGTRAVVGPRLRPLCHLSIRGDCLGLGHLSPPGSASSHYRTTDTHPSQVHTALTAATVAAIPAATLHMLIERHEGWRMFVLGELARRLRTQRLMHAITGSMVAPDRLLHFIHLMACRLRAAKGEYGDGVEGYRSSTLPLPLTQGEIGELLGLTNVSVNRALRTLEGKEMLNSSRDSVTLLREDAWLAELEFDLPPAEIGRVFGRMISQFN